MFEGSAGVHSLERVDCYEFPEDVEEVVPGGGEDVPELSARVMFELDVVWQFGHPGPALLSRGAQSQEDFPQLVQVRLSGQEGDPDERKVIIY